MAIDTRNRRACAICVPVLVPLPAPDGSVGQADRPQVAWLYRGFDADSGGSAVFLQAMGVWGPGG